MNRGVAVIWWGMLIATVAGVVPVAVTLLSRVLKAARNIEMYTAEALEGGVKIAGNTANVAALKDTIAVAPGLLAAASSLEQHTAAIASALAPAATEVSGAVGPGAGPGGDASDAGPITGNGRVDGPGEGPGDGVEVQS